jgi:hypothetical protein
MPRRPCWGAEFKPSLPVERSDVLTHTSQPIPRLPFVVFGWGINNRFEYSTSPVGWSSVPPRDRSCFAARRSVATIVAHSLSVSDGISKLMQDNAASVL